MKRAARKVLLAAGGLAVLTGAALFSGRLLLIAGKNAPKVEKAYFQTAENIPPFLKPYADILAEAANDTANGRTNEAAHTAAGAAASCKNIRIYAGNWFSDSDAPDISDDAKRCAILWLGSRQGIMTGGLEKYYAVWASTPLLRTYLQNAGIQAAYMPLFYLPDEKATVSGYSKADAEYREGSSEYNGADAEYREDTSEYNEADAEYNGAASEMLQKSHIAEKHRGGGMFFAIVGYPPFIEDILREKALPYRRYELDKPEQAAQMMREMPQQKAIFAEKTALGTQTLDIHPLFLAAAAREIPLIVPWIWPKEDTVNLFNDRVSFYTDKSGAEKMAAEVEQAEKKQDIRLPVQKRAAKAALLARREYSAESAGKRVRQALAMQPDQYKRPGSIFLPSEKSSINIDIPTAIGHYTAGDYALASDLAEGLTRGGAKVDLTFYNSLYKYPAETNILLRGFLPPFADDLSARTNIIYLAYAQFGEDGRRELLPTDEAYLETVAESARQADALATASQKLTEQLLAKGIPAHYIPQFTDTARFYPDFEESLKSDVLFVGANTFYRTAVPFLQQRGIAVDVYGPKWPIGTAKANYADNRILRKYYSSAKIVLNDTREGMKRFGFISNRIFDATACGTLVISDYMPEIEAIYGDSVPMYKNGDELARLVRYYLNPAHEPERREKAARAREITLRHFTAEQAAEKFQEIIHNIKK